MPDEALDALRATKGGRFLDCTLGGSGHTQLLLEANPNNVVVSVDRDESAVVRANHRLAKWIEASRLTLVHAAFAEVLRFCERESFHGVLADFGLSSDQLSGDRGFSFLTDSALDMRMDRSEDYSAASVVNELSERELTVVLKRGGVGSLAKAIARAVVRARPIASTAQLARTIEEATPMRLRRAGFHPATVPFQAIRMEVNQELDQIEQLLDAVPELVVSQGRFVAITFHSGEDKLVAQRMRRWESGETPPAMWRERRPSPQGRGGDIHHGTRAERVAAGESVGRVVTRKPLVPSEKEVEMNPRSRSARLRVFEFA
jgi:16S rRNA (cytosine1402-N4)-methyltransferase